MRQAAVGQEGRTVINWVGTAKQVASDVLARLGTAVTLTATYVDDPNDVTSDPP